MELKEIRTTIRDKMIEIGYVEWLDQSLDIDVPDTIIENSFRVSVTGGSTEPINQHVKKLSNDVVVNIWKKGFRSEIESQDAALEAVENILCEMLAVNFRTLPSFRRIDFDSYTIEPLVDEDNSSIAKIEMNFVVEIILAVTDDVE